MQTLILRVMKFLSAFYHGASHVTPADFSCIGIIVVFILGILTYNDGSFLRTRTSSEMTFGDPWTLRALFASLLGWFVFVCPMAVLQGKPFPWLPVLLASGATVTGTFRFLSSSQFTFDTQGHRYHPVSRWSWALDRASWTPRVRSGTYDDLTGIRVRRIISKGTTFYSVSIALKDDSGEI